MAPDTVLAQIKELWDEWASITEITREMHCGWRRVKEMRERYGIPPRTPAEWGKVSRKIGEDEWPKFKKLWNDIENHTIKSIANEFEVSERHVYRTARRIGLPPRWPMIHGRDMEVIRKEILKEIKAGTSMRSIMAKLHCDWKTMNSVYAANGIPRPGSGVKPKAKNWNFTGRSESARG